MKNFIAKNSRAYDSQERHNERADQFDKIAKTSAEKAAKVIINGILKNRKRQLVGADAKVIDILNRLFPQRFSDLIGFLHERALRKIDR